jgi:hypothetical protein
MVKSIVQILLATAFALVCGAADMPRQIQTDDIREVVFRHQLDSWDSYMQKTKRVYFLSVGEQDEDPSDDFIKRFANHKPPVRKASASKKGPHLEVMDKNTGEAGLILRVSSIMRISDIEVEVQGGYDQSGRSASGNIYTVKKINGKWSVTQDKRTWES